MNTHNKTFFAALLPCLIAAALICGQAPAAAQPTVEQEAAGPPGGIVLIQTDSPRQTIETFQALTRSLEERFNAYLVDKSRANFAALESLVPYFHTLIDLSAVAPSARYDVGMDTLGYLLDIFGRIDPLDLEAIPDQATVEAGQVGEYWRIPRTPITITKIQGGEREGEFLFAARTITVAPRFYKRIAHLPLRSSLEIASWTQAMPQVTGPMIPKWIPANIPAPLQEIWQKTPIWKVIAVALMTTLAAVLLTVFHRMVNRKKAKGQFSTALRRALTPIATLLFFSWFSNFITLQINVAGGFAIIVETTTTIIMYLAAAWLAWLLLRALFAGIVRSRNIPEDSFDAHLWRLAGKLLGIAAVVVILARAAHYLGVPLYSVIAGLGIGGLAVALAIRPTLENLIGGIILYVDQPVRVGDFCSFGDKTGTIESIGVRSTKLRALDRTLISIPNAALADMQLINYAKCDRMLIMTIIGLRYETEPDQMRYVLVKIREMLHAHPRIDSETIRVRFFEYGASSLDIQIRIYALTRDWNEFFAIREDVLLRINDIVREAGTGFAFPSQTMYFSRDQGLDEKSSQAAVKAVQSWRRSGKLPFPRLSRERIDRLHGTLDYPPRGSVEAGSPPEDWGEAAEPLSTTPEPSEGTEENMKKQTTEEKEAL
ncbi:MAG: mechanosensitive ion channel family protein [Desulfobacteraceae bacterium]|nr:mechanosensitive ion channel family protein [Desulfobacteraceae bacterium]